MGSVQSLSLKLLFLVILTRHWSELTGTRGCLGAAGNGKKLWEVGLDDVQENYGSEEDRDAILSSFFNAQVRSRSRSSCFRPQLKLPPPHQRAAASICCVIPGLHASALRRVRRRPA